jgi:hypothetical protein
MSGVLTQQDPGDLDPLRGRNAEEGLPCGPSAEHLRRFDLSRRFMKRTSDQIRCQSFRASCLNLLYENDSFRMFRVK